MRRVLLALGVAVLLGSPGAALGTSHPRLWLISRVPLKVGGSGFRSKERVTVTAGGYRLRIRTSNAGRFAAQFAFGAHCGGPVYVRATGSHGERVVLHLAPLLCAYPAPSG